MIARLRIIVALYAPLALGCQQEMANQPSYRPLEQSTFFADGRSARPLVANTVPQGPLRVGQPMYTGRTGTGVNNANTQTISGSSASLGGQSVEDYVTELPFPISAEVLKRGQERYTIYCSVCHGGTGVGDGKVVERGYTKPPSFITDNSRGLERRGIKIALRDAPLGYLFDVMTQGYGAMADYSTQVPVRDRWAIAAYIRVLQLSQHAPLDVLPGQERQDAQRALEVAP